MIADCKQIAEIIKLSVKQFMINRRDALIKACGNVSKLEPKYQKNIKLVVIQVGSDSASCVYVNNKRKACEECGIPFEHWNFPVEVTKEELKASIELLNKDKSVSSIILQMPIPQHLQGCEKFIAKEKDVDGLVDGSEYIPCTPRGIMAILSWYNIDIDGKRCVVVGRSDIVGKPIANLLLNKNGTITICHSHTKDLAMYTRNADIIVAAVGKPKFIVAEMVKKGAVVIDVGINRKEGSKKIVGDVDFDKVKDKCELITPVPGGVGAMTIACLLLNVIGQ